MVGNTRAMTRKAVIDKAAKDSKPLRKAKSSTAMAKKDQEDVMKNGSKFGGAKVKRMAQNSPNEAPMKKRSAFADVTNAVPRNASIAKKTVKPTKSIVTAKKSTVAGEVKRTVSKLKVRKSKEAPEESKTLSLPFAEKDAVKSVESSTNSFENDSLESNLTDSDILKLSSDGLTSSQEQAALQDTLPLSPQIEPTIPEFIVPETKRILPDGVRDVDQDDDPFAVCEYVESIFRNMKIAERKFAVTKYLDDKKSLMRPILVDWLVEVQENFELFHETLYLAIRILDLYLQKKECKRENLQLVGATAMFIASKIEERHAPPLDDFVFVCDDAYKSNQFIKMEIDILATLNYELGIPISYRFLRRYSRVAGAPTEILTLARYILESSLVEYEFIDCRPSKIAAAALNLAFKMKNTLEWDRTLVYHTGYEEQELKDLVIRLNKMICAPAKKNLTTVRSKYSHPVFLEVAKTPTITIEE